MTKQGLSKAGIIRGAIRKARQILYSTTPSFAAFFQLVGLFVFKREISWIVLILVVFEFIGGYIAANFVHPHIADLPEYAQKVYDEYAVCNVDLLRDIAVLLKRGRLKVLALRENYLESREFSLEIVCKKKFFKKSITALFVTLEPPCCRQEQ